MSRWMLGLLLLPGVLQAQGDPAAAALAQAYEVGTQAAFAAVADAFPDSAAGAEAAWRVGAFLLRQGRFADAAEVYRLVAAHPRASAPVATESLLQAGLCPLHEYRAGSATGEAGRLLLAAAADRLQAARAELGGTPTALAQTGAAYAGCGLAEALLLLGEPEAAGAAARSALGQNGAAEPVMAAARLQFGRACLRLRRFRQAAECLAAASSAAPGAVIEQLVVGAEVPARARAELAVALEALGELEPALDAASAAVALADDLVGSADGRVALAGARSLQTRLVARLTH